MTPDVHLRRQRVLHDGHGPIDRDPAVRAVGQPRNQVERRSDVGTRGRARGARPVLPAEVVHRPINCLLRLIRCQRRTHAADSEAARDNRPRIQTDVDLEQKVGEPAGIGLCGVRQVGRDEQRRRRP